MDTWEIAAAVHSIAANHDRKLGICSFPGNFYFNFRRSALSNSPQNITPIYYRFGNSLDLII